MAVDGRYDGRILVPAVLLTLVTVVVAVGAVLGHRPAPAVALPPRPNPPAVQPHPSTATPRPAVTSTAGPHWAALVRRLARRRVAAYRAGDLRALGAVYAPHSPTRRRDTALLRSLVDKRLHVDGLRVWVRRVAVRSRAPRRVTLLVTDLMSRYALRGPQGQPFGHRAPLRGRWEMTLVTSAGRWKIWRVAGAQPTRAPSAASMSS